MPFSTIMNIVAIGKRFVSIIGYNNDFIILNLDLLNFLHL